jgi:hypothetical protein
VIIEKVSGENVRSAYHGRKEKNYPNKGNKKTEMYEYMYKYVSTAKVIRYLRRVQVSQRERERG